METKPTSSVAAQPAAPALANGLRPEDIPCLDAIKTEDDRPVDNIYSALQQKLLTEPLYSSWAGPGEGRKFLAVSNVGLFYAAKKPPLVPDAMLSLDVELGNDPLEKENRSYFTWILGKPPEVVIEVISNVEGEEDTRKFRLYAQLGVLYYVIWDPGLHLGSDPLRIYSLSEKRYAPLQGRFLPVVGLGLTTWNGMFESWPTRWLRWCDATGAVIPTGAERAEEERRRAEDERQRAQEAEGRAAKLAARLRALGVDPDSVK
ncbi:MAG: Uma2 family endonuclease [Planctomycetes bacterium]|nr:Uma2 family endonuclease [Planctomycetota bacterium]